MENENSLTPAERKRASREKQMFEIGWMIDRGYPVFVIARRPGMPMLDKLWRWITDRPDLRRRYEEATYWRQAQLADHTVDLRPVEVARTRGDETIIASGLRAGETVVTDGQIRLVAGSRITIKTVDALKSES